MRIISGKYKNRKLVFPYKKSRIRPYSGFIKKTIFTILEHNELFTRKRKNKGVLKGAKVADIFAGTGTVGLEAFSRGAEKIMFVDKNILAIKTIKKNLKILGIENNENIRIKKWNAIFLPNIKEVFDLIFLDPPYKDPIGGKCLQILEKKNWVNRGTVCILRSKNERFIVPLNYEIIKEKDYGEHKIFFIEYIKEDLPKL